MQVSGAKLMFIEVNNDDEEFLSAHYRTTVKYSEDYKGVCDADSVRDQPYSLVVFQS